MLMVMSTRWPATRIGGRKASLIRAAVSAVASTWPKSSRSSPNSSPPSREIVSALAVHDRSRSATSRRTSSPARWPRVSLTDFEVVEVAHHERNRLAPALSPQQRVVDPIGEQDPVPQPGERVVGGLMGELGLPFSKLDDRRLEPAREPGILHDGEELADEDERDGDGADPHEEGVEAAARRRSRHGHHDGKAERYVGEQRLCRRQLPAGTFGRHRWRGHDRCQEYQRGSRRCNPCRRCFRSRSCSCRRSRCRRCRLSRMRGARAPSVRARDASTSAPSRVRTAPRCTARCRWRGTQGPRSGRVCSRRRCDRRRRVPSTS